jgi:hypothetical protein
MDIKNNIYREVRVKLLIAFRELYNIYWEE